MKHSFLAFLFVFTILGCATVPKDPVDSYLSKGTWEEGLKAYNSYSLGGQNAFEKGFIMTMQVLEKLFQDLDRYGVGRSREAQSFTGGPFPWSSTKSPEGINYEKFIKIFADARDGLKAASGVLEKAGTGDWKVLVHPGLIVLDFNGDGKRTPEENLGSVFRWVSRMESLSQKDIDDFYFNHDCADALWLAGYTRLIEGLLDFILAYDLKPLWNGFSHYVFPVVTDPSENSFNIFSSAFKFTVVNKASGEAARQAFLKVAELSPLSWQKILEEKDNDHEWLTGPGQTSVFGLEVSQSRIEGWLEFMGSWTQLLEGKKLIPYKEENSGLNLKKFFQDLPLLDADFEERLVKNYVEFNAPKEKILTNARDLSRYIMGDDLMFALWFN